MLVSIRVFSDDDVWCCGDYGNIRHFDGSEWSLTELDTTSTLLTIDGTSPNDLWVGGIGGFLAHYDGSTWQTVPSPVTTDITELFVFSSEQIFASARGGKILKFDGSEWTSIQSCSLSSFNGLAYSEGNFWCVGDHANLMQYISDETFPTPSPTAQPSSTPSPQPPTPTPTTTPPPTSTATPFPTNTPSPHNRDLSLFMEDNDLTAGDHFFLYFEIYNPDNTPLDCDTYILLGIYGQYWCWPSWISIQDSIDKKSFSIPAKHQYKEIVLDFQWPDDVGSASDLLFIGGIFQENTFDIIGDIDTITWSYH